MKNERIIKATLNRLNATKYRLADIFFIMHDNRNIFCQQIRERFYVQELSYAEIKRRALTLATALSPLYSNCRIGIKMHNSYEFVVLFWGILLSGNTPVLINTEFDAAATNTIISDLELKTIFDDLAARELCKSIETKVEPLDFNYDNASDEFVLTTSAAMGKAKYCFYNGASIARFLNKTPLVVKRIPQIIKAKQIKQLAFLPFFHCFGLFAVYFWFGFFGIQFLFIDNTLTDLMQNIRNYKVTHIFAVPLFYKTIQREILKKVKATNRLKEFNEGLEKAYRLQSKLPGLRKIIRKKFKEVVDNTLGSDICFMISGGASIDAETLKLFNSIGYDLHVGYGMTEVGITSLNLNPDIKSRCTVSIGEPLPNVAYRLNQDNILEIVSDTGAYKVIKGDELIHTGGGKFYNTKDKCFKEGEIYKFEARDDEIIAAENGENYNLNSLQSTNYGFEFIEDFCFIPYKNNVAFLISVSGLPSENVDKIIEEVRINEVLKTKRVSGILITEQPLQKGLKLINYRDIVRQINNKTIEVCEIGNYSRQNSYTENNSPDGQIKKIVAKALDFKGEIADNADLFLELGCTSFDYYIIIQDITEAFAVDLSKLNTNDKGFWDSADIPRTILELKRFVQENKLD